MQSLTYPDGSVVERTYNSRGQLHTVEWNGAVIDTRTYDPRGLLQQNTYGSGVVTDFGYRDDGLVQSIATTNAGSQKVGTYTYTYDANKNKTSETITGAGVMNDYGFGQAQTAYDSEDRLTGWNRDDNQQNQTWQLSPVGDWNQFTENNQATAFVHNDAHELTSADGNDINYDAKGNQLNLTSGLSPAAFSLTWDQDNRLTAAGDHGFEYDALGRRVSIDDSADTKILVCAGQQLIATYASGAPASSPNQTFVYGSYIDEPIAMIDGGSTYFYSRNQQFSVTALTDNTGTVVERYAYDAYGNTLILSDNGAARTVSDLGNPFTFTGRYLHPEIDLLYFRARYYEPETGRFIGRDPLQYVDGMSLYRGYFVPRGVDPAGLRTIDLWWWWYFAARGLPLDLNIFGRPVLEKINAHPETARATNSINRQIIEKAILAAAGRSCGECLFRQVFSGTASAEYATGTLPGDLLFGALEVLEGASGDWIIEFDGDIYQFIPDDPDIENTTLFALGAVQWEGRTTCDVYLGNCVEGLHHPQRTVDVQCGHVRYEIMNESFNNPFDLAGGFPMQGEIGSPYQIFGTLYSTNELTGDGSTFGIAERFMDDCECNG